MWVECKKEHSERVSKKLELPIVSEENWIGKERKIIDYRYSKKRIR